MKIPKDNILEVGRRGSLSLQVPEMFVRVKKGCEFSSHHASEDVDAIEMPDEWFMRLKACSSRLFFDPERFSVPGFKSGIERLGYRMLFGKEKGVLFLSPAGWESNRELIINQWSPKRFTSEVLDPFVSAFFDSVKRSTEIYRHGLIEKANSAPECNW